MTKKDILKATGLSEKEFYKLYPTQEHFQKDMHKYDLGGILSGASTGASMGSGFGIYGKIIGGLLGAAGGQVGDILGQNREIAGYDKIVQQKYENGELAYGGLLNELGQLTDNPELVTQLGGLAAMGISAIGKGKDSKGFAFGGNMTESINAGGTHEQNPNEGVNIGNKGLVEEGEVKFNYKDQTGDNSYIFSKRLGFANKAKSIMKKFDVRPNDKMATEAKEQRLKGLMNEQEQVRSSMFDNQFKKAFGGKLKKYSGLNDYPSVLGSNKGNAEPIETSSGLEWRNAEPSTRFYEPPKAGEFGLGTHQNGSNFWGASSGLPLNMNAAKSGRGMLNDLYPNMGTDIIDGNNNLIGREFKNPSPSAPLNMQNIPVKNSGIDYLGTFNKSSNKFVGPNGPVLPEKYKSLYQKPTSTSKTPVTDKGYNNKLNKFGQYGQFAGALSKLAVAAMGPDAVNLQRMKNHNINSLPEEVIASNELNQVYNNLNKDIRNNAGSNAGSYLASRIASASNQADKTGSILSGIRSKYNEFNTRNNMAVDQFNTQTSHTEDDLRTREKDAVRTLLMDAASQAGNVNANINRDNMGYKNEQDLLGLMQSQDFNLEQDPTTGRYKLSSKYKKGFGGFMYKSKSKKK